MSDALSAAADPVHAGSAVSIMRRAMRSTAAGTDGRDAGLLALLLAGGGAGSGVPRRRRKATGPGRDVNTEAEGVRPGVIGDRPQGIGALTAVSSSRASTAGAAKLAVVPPGRSLGHAQRSALPRGRQGLAGERTIVANAALVAPLVAVKNARLPPQALSGLSMPRAGLGAVLKAVSAGNEPPRPDLGRGRMMTQRATPAAMRQAPGVERYGRQALRRRGFAGPSTIDGQYASAITAPGTGRSPEGPPFAGPAGNRHLSSAQDGRSAIGSLPSRLFMAPPAGPAIVTATTGVAAGVSGNETALQAAMSKHVAFVGAGIVPRRIASASSGETAPSGGFTTGARSAGLRSSSAGPLRDGVPQVQATSSGASSGSSAPDGNGRGTMIALTGEIAIDGRKLGRTTAASQVSSASLPPRSASAVNIRAMPVFTGSSVPL